MATRPKSQTPLNVRRQRRRPRWDEEDMDDLAYTLLGPGRRLSVAGQNVVARHMERVEAIFAARRLTKTFQKEAEDHGNEDLSSL